MHLRSARFRGVFVVKLLLLSLLTGQIISRDRATPSDLYPFVRMLIQTTAKHWKAYVEHEFVKQLARGTLPVECLQHVTKYVSTRMLRNRLLTAPQTRDALHEILR